MSQTRREACLRLGHEWVLDERGAATCSRCGLSLGTPEEYADVLIRIAGTARHTWLGESDESDEA